MKVLVTGGTGFIGSITAAELLKKGHEVVIVDNLINSSVEALDGIEKEGGSRPDFYEIDLRDVEGMKKVFQEHRIDAVIHFAGLKAVGESVAKPLMYYDNNLISSIKLFELMEEYGVKNLIFSSSATVYGASEKVPYAEDHPVEIRTNPYGRTKATIEFILEDLCHADKDFSGILLRYFNPIGASEKGFLGEDPTDIPNNLVPYITKVAAGELEVLGVFGDDYPTEDGTGIRDYLHVVDLAKGHVAALDYCCKNKGCEVFNLGSGKGTSVFQMIETFEKVNGVPVAYQVAPRRPGDAPVSFADPSKAWEMLGWKTSKTLEDMLRDAWKWQQFQISKEK